MTSEVRDRKNPLVKRGIAWIAASAVLAIAAVGGTVIYTRRSSSTAEAVDVRVLNVEREDVERTVNESGVVQLGNQQTLKAPSDTTVAEVRVQVGDRVSTGQELIVLRDAEQLTQLEEHLLNIRSAEVDLSAKRQDVRNAEASLATAQRIFDNLRSQARDADPTPLVERQLEIRRTALQLDNQQAAVREAREALEIERETLERDRELYDGGFISLNELQRRESNVRSAESQLREAQLQANTTQLQLESLRAGIESIQRNIEDERTEIAAELQAAASDVRVAEIALDDARVAANTAELNLQQLQIQAETIEERLQSRIVSAPSPGKVLDINVVRGDVVELGADLLTIGDPDREIIELQLSTLNAREVQPNQPARISIIGPDSETYDGRVETISLRADPGESASSDSGDTAAVAATVSLDAPSGTLIPGSQASVEIVLDRQTDVLTLDIEAIRDLDSDPYVWVIDEAGMVRKQPVTVGLNGLTTVEIRDGLENGDRVAVPPVDAELSDGTPIDPVDATPFAP